MVSKVMFQPRRLRNVEALTLVVSPDEPVGTLQPCLSLVSLSLLETLFVFQGSLFLHAEWR